MSLIAALWALAAAFAIFWMWREGRQRPDPRIEAAQSDDERRLAATTDPARRAKLLRRMNNRTKEK
jgi:hypothetical protein